MTAATRPTAPQPTRAGSPAARVLALAQTEVRLLGRNKTVAVSAIVLPLGLGMFWALTFDADGEPGRYALIIALQLAVVLAMGIYVTATQTLVARRHSRLLKRMRTTGLSDRGLLTAIVAPSVLLGLVQLAIFAAFDVGSGGPLPSDPVPLAVAVVGGLALVVTAALATSTVTPSPERAQITTLPLTFVMLAAAVALSVIPLEGWWQALVIVPGAAAGQLTQLAMTGGTWEAGLAGLPAVLPAVVASIVWPVVFATLALRHFHWDPRH